MKNQIATAGATLITCVNWDQEGIDPQVIIDAAKNKRLQKPLTDWLASLGWNLGKFVAKDHLKIGTGPNDTPKISGMGTNFKNWHLNTVEEMKAISKLVPFVFPVTMYDRDIIVQLGGVQKAITSLTDIWAKIKLQPEGPKSPAGDLLTNGYANLFYVPQPVNKLDGNRFSYIDLEGKEIFDQVADPQYLFQVGNQWFVLRVVYVRWYDDGWYLYADSVEDPDRWDAGYQAFSRNSDIKPSVTAVI